MALVFLAGMVVGAVLMYGGLLVWSLWVARKGA